MKKAAIACWVFGGLCLALVIPLGIYVSKMSALNFAISGLSIVVNGFTFRMIRH